MNTSSSYGLEEGDFFERFDAARQNIKKKHMALKCLKGIIYARPCRYAHDSKNMLSVHSVITFPPTGSSFFRCKSKPISGSIEGNVVPPTLFFTIFEPDLTIQVTNQLNEYVRSTNSHRYTRKKNGETKTFDE